MSYQLYSNIVQDFDTATDWIESEIKTISDVNKVSRYIEDVQNDQNFPLVVLWQQSITFDQDEISGVGSLIVYVKTKSINPTDNNNVISQILDKIGGQTADGSVVTITPTTIENDIDTFQGLKTGIKSLVSVLELQLIF